MPRLGAALALALIPLVPAIGDDVPTPPQRPPELFAPHAHGSPVDLDIPLPPPRPGDLASPAVPTSQAPASPASPTPAVPASPTLATPTPAPSATPSTASEKDAATCKALFESGTVIARPVAPIRGAGECGIDAPVVLEAVVVANKRAVRFEPTPTIRCDLAATLARWVTTDVEPMLAAQNLTLERITNADAYSCRGRNRVPGAKLSEHGKGNAIDLEALIVAPARRIPLTGPDSAPVAAAMRASACARFATVLGPGSDGYHDTHIHLDLEDRRTHGTLCQWRLP